MLHFWIMFKINFPTLVGIYACESFMKYASDDRIGYSNIFGIAMGSFQVNALKVGTVKILFRAKQKKFLHCLYVCVYNAFQ